MIIKALFSKQEYDNYRRNPERTIKVIRADDAEKGHVYCCPFCGTDLHLKVSVNDTHFFACYPNKPHTQKSCIRIAKRSEAVDTDIPSFDLGLFFNSLLQPETNTKPPKKGGEELEEKNENLGEDELFSDDSESPETLTDGEEDPDQLIESEEEIAPDDTLVKIVPPKTIRDILDLGYNRIRGNELINSTSKIKVSDLIIGLPSLSMLANNPEMIDHAVRIIEMRALFNSHFDNSIICRSFFKNDDGEYTEIYFYLHTESHRQFNSLFDKLLKKIADSETGKLVLKPLHKSIYICGNWVLSKTPHKYKGKEYLRFDTNIINIRKQVYCSPDDRF